MTKKLINVSDGTDTFAINPDADDGISLETLQTAFPSAVNLLDTTHESRKFLLSVRNGVVYNPLGWDESVTYVVHSGSRPTTPLLLDFTSNFGLVKPFLFSIPEENGFNSCATAITSKFLVTFRHGPHSCYEDDTEVTVVSVQSKQEYVARVFYISEELDYVILKTEEDVVTRDAPIVSCEPMERFVVCGFAKGFLESTFVHGTIFSTVPMVFEDDSGKHGPFVYGSAKTSTGDSGAACFGKHGLMAINLGITKMRRQFHDEAISQAAIFAPNNYMVKADTIRETLASLQPKKSSKRPHQVISFDGVREFGF